MKKILFMFAAAAAMIAMPIWSAGAAPAPIKYKPFTTGELSKLYGKSGARGGKLQLQKRFQKKGARGKKVSQEKILEAANKLAKRLAAKGIDVRDKSWQSKLAKKRAAALKKANSGWLKLKKKKPIKLVTKSKTGFRFFKKGSRGKADRRFKVDGNHKLGSSGARGGGKKQEYVWQKSTDAYSWGDKKWFRTENKTGVSLRAKSKHLKFNAYANSTLYVFKKKDNVFDTALTLTATDKKFSSAFHVTLGMGKPWKPGALNFSKNAALDISGKQEKKFNWNRKGKIDLDVIEAGYTLSFSASAGVHYSVKLNPTLAAASAKPYVKATAAASAFAECLAGACWGKVSGSATIIDTYLDVAGEAELKNDNKGLYVVTQAHAAYKVIALKGKIKAEWDCWLFCSKKTKNLTKSGGVIDKKDDIFRLNQKKTYLIGGKASGGKKTPAAAAVAQSAKKFGKVFDAWKWNLVKCPAGHKCIVSKMNSKLALNTQAENSSAKATAYNKGMWSAHWKLHKVRGQKDTYRIVNRWKGKKKKFKSWPSLIVEGGKLKLRVMSKNRGDTKGHWIVTTNKDGTRTIKNRANPKMILGTNGKKTGLGAKLQ